MTRLMKKAIEELGAVPENQQDSFAEFLLHELAEDERWAGTTAANTGKLEELIRSIVADNAAGRCDPLNPDLL